MAASTKAADPSSCIVEMSSAARMDAPAAFLPPGPSFSGGGDAAMDDDTCSASGAETEAEGWSSAPPSDVVASARPRRRAVAQPLRLDSSPPVLCYKFEQGRAASSSGRWQGRQAHLHYYLPENWSPSYRFTVFEDSYILSLAHEPEPPHGSAQQQPPPPPPLVPHVPREGLRPRGPRQTAPPSFEPLPPHSPSSSTARAFHLARPLCAGPPRSAAGAAAALSAATTLTPAAEFELVWPVGLDGALLEAVEAACDRVVPGAKRKLHSAISLNGVNLKLQRLEM